MRKMMILVLGCALCVVGLASWVLTPLRDFLWSQDAQRLTQDANEIVIVKAPSKEPRNPYQIEYEQMLYPTVRITAGYSTGSGVVISNTNHTNKDEWTRIDILTAAHVVEDQNIVNIEFYNLEVITGTVVITDTSKDLALIRVICGICDIRYRGLCGVRVKDIYSAQLASRDYKPYLFTPVWTVGCSLGLEPRPSQGIISSVGRHPECNEGSHNNRDSSASPQNDIPQYWEISAPILPGNSGGPVFDARTYEVIGIAVWVKVYSGQLVTTMAGVVPINQIHEFLTSHQDTKTPRR